MMTPGKVAMGTTTSNMREPFPMSLMHLNIAPDSDLFNWKQPDHMVLIYHNKPPPTP
jgi:hypothetical protein